MKIACVGAHRSDMDYAILAEALSLVKMRATRKIHPDMIDLREGRDFLKESLLYDVVTLNYIFVLSPTEYYKILRGGRDLPDYRTSELHTPNNWRRRLLQTGAREILVFGYSPHSEVTGDYIGELKGYSLKHIETRRGSIWHYTKR